jgi:hypothetical protein
MPPPDLHLGDVFAEVLHVRPDRERRLGRHHLILAPARPLIGMVQVRDSASWHSVG